MKNKPLTTCRLCGEDHLKPALVLAGHNDLGLGFSLGRCPDCGTWQVNPPVSPEIIRNYFLDPKRWNPATDPNGQLVDPKLRQEARWGEYAKYAATLGPLLAPGDKVVDIGAGGGLMLSLLPENLKRLAAEPHPQGAEMARRRGLEVTSDWAEDLHFPHCGLSAVIMNQSFDHLLDPGYLLAEVVGWLRPGGFLLLSGLINPQSFMARVYGSRFRLWHPLHQIYPPPAAMVKILGMRGLEIKHWWRPYFGTPYGSFLKLGRAIPEVLAQIFNHELGGISPPWPGNTYSLLAQKTVLTLDLKSPALA